MAVYGGADPILGGMPMNRASARNILLALQGARGFMGGPAAPGLIGPPVRQGPRLIGPPVQAPGGPRLIGPPITPGGSEVGIPEGGLIPLPNPQAATQSIFQKNAAQIRQGLLDFLHPNIPGRMISQRRLISAKRAEAGSIPQNNLRIAIPAVGAFHHNASVSNGRAAQLAQLRQQHVAQAQQQAQHMTGMMRKARGLGRGIGQPRRAFYAGY